MLASKTFIELATNFMQQASPSWPPNANGETGYCTSQESPRSATFNNASNFSVILNDSYDNREQSRMIFRLLLHFPSPEQSIALVDRFFSTTQANYYFIHETTFRSKFDETIAVTASQNQQPDSEFLVLAHMVFATASLTGRTHDPAVQDRVPGVQHFNLAHKYIPQIISEGSFTGIQILLLMTVYILSTESTEASYKYASLALRSSIILQLHVQNSSDDLPPEMREVRRRIFWTAYIIERYECLKLSI